HPQVTNILFADASVRFVRLQSSRASSKQWRRLRAVKRSARSAIIRLPFTAEERGGKEKAAGNFLCGKKLLSLIPQIRRQPALHFLDRQLLAGGIAFYLIPRDEID